MQNPKQHIIMKKTNSSENQIRAVYDCVKNSVMILTETFSCAKAFPEGKALVREESDIKNSLLQWSPLQRNRQICIMLLTFDGEIACIAAF